MMQDFRRNYKFTTLSDHLFTKTEMSEMSNTEEREDTACIEITCSVKGYQECNFTVDVGEEFFIFKKIGSKGRAFKVTNTKGQLRHLERTLVSPLWPFKDGMKW